MRARVVLVIEDNPIARKLVRLTLGNEGMTVIEAGDGAEALALTSNTRPDLIIQDLLLPDMDGFELLRRLRARPTMTDVPIIACSGFLSRLEYGRATAMGFTDFMAKPVEPSRLVQVVRAHLPPEPATQEQVGGGRRVLVVDDDPVQLKLARIRLAELGFEVATATNGAEALDVLQRDGTDAVVSDVLMPHVDGFSLCVAIRNAPDLGHVPVILVSSNYVEEADHQVGRTMGASAFVVRTPDLAGVIHALDMALNAPSNAPLASLDPEPTEPSQHHERVLRQLERQAALNARLAHQSAMHASMLSVVAGISESLTKRHSVDDAGPDILASLLEASGVSVGALFMRDSHAVESGAPALDDLVLRAVMGLSPGVGDEVATFFGHREIFARAVAAKSPLVVSSTVESSAERDLLARVGMKSAWLVPCVADEECLGLFLLASQTRDLTDGDWIPFARTIAVQIGQALSLGRTFSTLEHEILERKQAESAVRQERDRAQRYLDTAEVLLLATDVDGRVMLINRKGCDILGWTEGDLLGRDFVETCLPARIQAAIRKKHLSVLGGDVAVVENPIVTRSGEERLIEWHNVAQHDGAGNVIGTFSSGTDVTERHQAEAQVRLQSAALNAAANAMVITDRAGLIEWVNPAFSELTGYAEAEAVGKNPRDLVKSDQHDQPFYKNLWDTILAGRVWRGEIINRRKDGSLYTEEQTITPWRDPQGEISHFIDVKQDITERKRAEEEIRQGVQLSGLGAAVGLALANSDTLALALQRCAEALVAHLGAAFARVWTFNERDDVLELEGSAGLYTHVNSPYGKEPLGQTKIGRIARDRRPHLTNTVIGDPEVSDQGWARREGMVAFAGHPLIVDGRVVGVMALFARHPLSDAIISALASVARHVALGIERHRSAEALQITEERMRFALKSADVGIWDMDYTTGVNRWSETLEAHYGLQPGTFGGTFEAFVDRIHPDDRTSVLDIVGKAMKSGTDFSILNRTIWPDGTIRWLNGIGRVLLGEHGEPVRAVGISLDVTDRRTLEEQYQQAQKMEAVGRLAGGVAHDFNNLLTVILGYCELLLSDFKPGDPHQADIAEIQKAGARAGGLTRQLLAFSRKQIIEPTLLDLNQIATDMRAMLGRLIGEDVRIVLVLRPELASVKADRGQVEQVVMNLAVNARDAMPKGGTLTIETANVELDEHYAKTHRTVKPGAYVALTVTDTGTGMTPEVQARLFEPFFTTKDVGKGTGLGMATVYGIVTRSGGSVGVYSEIGRGTSFKVYFPRTDVTETIVEVPPVVARPRAGTQTVLVVEDEEGLRDLAKRLLERQGYNVLVAANAAEGLWLFDQNASIDVLVTDVVMPGASGPELTDELVKRRPGLKVIYMSGYTEDAIVQHGVLKPGIAFLNKPFTSETLGSKIREVLEREDFGLHTQTLNAKVSGQR